MESPQGLLVKCPSCSSTLSASVIIDHQRYHNALKILKYNQAGNNPLSLDTISQARSLAVKNILARFKNRLDHPELAKRLNRVNEAFDDARSQLNRGKSICTTLSPLIEKVKEKDGGKSVDEQAVLNDIKSECYSANLPECVVAIGTSCAQNITYKDVMEDRTSVQTEFESLNNKNKLKKSSCFLGLYDGYFGSAAAQKTQQTLHHLVQEEIQKEKTFHREDMSLKLNKAEARKILKDLSCSFTIASDEDVSSDKKEQSSLLSSTAILKSCQRAYQKMDENLGWGEYESSRVRWSGCSATTILIADDEEESNQTKNNLEENTENNAKTNTDKVKGKLFVSNVGNVYAYISHNNKPFRLTQRHTINNLKERNRVEEAGGKIVGKNNFWTINSVLATTRGLGNHGDPELRNCVIADPATATAGITGDTQFLVMASSSIWSLFDASEIHYIISNTTRTKSLVSNVISDETASIQETKSVDADDVFFPDPPESDAQSIVLPEESNEGIEEVVIVERKRADYDDEEESEVGHVTNEETEVMSGNEETEVMSGNEDQRRSSSTNNPIDTDTQPPPYDRLAQLMSERLVHAALAAGSKENVSVVVVLFKGFFA